VERLLDGSSQPRPVDADEAARGRVDFAQAVTWDERALAALPRADASGNVAVDWKPIGEDDDGSVLDNLQIASFAPGGSPTVASDPDVPFYEQVVRRMQYLDAKGELNISSDPRTGPLPPTSAWAPGITDVGQYLTDVYAIHEAIHSAAAALAPRLHDGDTAQLATWLCSAQASERLHAIQQDRDTALAACAPAAAAQLKVSATALAHVQILAALRDVGSEGNGEEADSTPMDAAAALCAHGFMLQVSSLSFGTAVLRPLFQRVFLAASASREPKAFFSQPGLQVAQLRKDMDCVGGVLSVQANAIALQAFWLALPTAVKRTGLLLGPLAKTEK